MMNAGHGGVVVFLLVWSAACSDPEPTDRTGVEEVRVEREPEPACTGIAMAELDGSRVPALLLSVLGDEAAGARLEMSFGNAQDLYATRSGGSGQPMLIWSLDRAFGPGHWELEPARARMMELAPEAEAETDTGGYGHALRMDLGERAGGHLHFEQVRSNFGADRASLTCAGENAEWVLTVERARELRMFPARVPSAVLDALGAELPITGFVARARLVRLAFGERRLDTDPVVAALRASGFVEPESVPGREALERRLASVAVTLRAPTGIQVEVMRNGATLTFTAPTIGDALVCSGG